MATETNEQYYSPTVGGGTTLPSMKSVRSRSFFVHENNGVEDFYLAYKNKWLKLNITENDTLKVKTIEAVNLFAKTATIRKTNISNGDLAVSDGGIVESVSGSAIYIRDDSGYKVAPFSANDLICSLRVKLDNSANIAYVQATVNSVEGNKVNITYTSSSVFQAGDNVFRVGNTTDSTRQDIIYLSTNLDDSPYIDVLDSINSFSDWDTPVPKVRIGKLTGITDVDFGGALSGYGLYSQNVYLKGKLYITSNSDITGLTVPTIYRQSTTPSSPKEQDLWYDTTSSVVTLKRFNGTSWEVVGNNGTYIDGTGVYTGTLAANQIIAGSGFINNLSVYSTFTLGSSSSYGYIQTYGWNGTVNGIQIKGGATPTVKIIGGEITLTSGDLLETILDEKKRVMRSATAPTTHLSTGDIWIDTDDGDKPYTYNGSSWVAAYTSIDGGNLVTGTVTAAKLNVSELSAITATLGSAVVGTSSTAGYLQSYDYVASTSGWKIAKGLAEFNGATLSGGTISIGSGNNIFKADSNGIYLGNATFASAPFSVSMVGALKATSAKLGTSLDYWSVQNSSITAVSNSNDVTINHGKTDFGQDTTAGFILGYDASALKSKFEIGSTATGLLKYDGSLSLTGGTITGGTIQTATSGRRVKIDNGDNIFFYTSSNTNLAQIYTPSDTELYIGCYGDLVLRGTDVEIGGTTGYTDISGSSGVRVLSSGNFSIGNPILAFTVNTSGQLTKINNLAASSYTGYSLVSDGTSFTPSTSSYSGSYYNIISNTETSNTSALAGFYAKANQGGSQAGLAIQVFASQYSDATLAGYGRLVTDASLDGLVLGVATGDLISFRVNNTEYAKVTSSGMYASAYYTGTTLGYLTSALGSKSGSIGTTTTGTALYTRSLTINGVTISVVTTD